MSSHEDSGSCKLGAYFPEFFFLPNKENARLQTGLHVSRQTEKRTFLCGREFFWVLMLKQTLFRLKEHDLPRVSI